MFKKLWILGLIFALSIGSAHAQNTVQISHLPSPPSGSPLLSNGDIVPVTRGNTTYGVVAGFGNTCATNQWVSSTNSQGVGSCTQPAAGNISGLGSAATVNIGTNGATIPVLNANNVFSGNEQFTGGVEIGTPTGGMPSAGTINAAALQINGASVAAGGISALTGDVTATGPGSAAATLATVNTSPGTFGAATVVPVITVNGKGLATAIGTAAITPAAIGAPTTTGTGANGTWAINVSGNALTVTTNANLTGDVTSSGNATSIAAATVTGKALTGFSAGTGTVSASDSILTAFNKIVGNINAIVTGVSSVFGRTGAVTAQTGDYAVAQITGAAPIASPNFTGTVTIPSGAALGTPASIVLTNATGTATSLNIGGTAPAGTLTGTALASNVVGSSLTGVGTIASGIWNGTIVGGAYGGTGTNNGANALTVPATGTADLLGTAQTFTAAKTFGNSGVVLLGSSTGTTTLFSANGGATNYTLTLPAVTDTVTTNAAAQTLTNKTLTSPTLASPIMTLAALGTPASGVMTNVTGLPLTSGVTGTLGTANGGTGLSTQTPSAPEFLTIGTTGVMSGSFLGTSIGEYNNYAGLFEVSSGTSGAPVTTAGPTVKLSLTEAIAAASCNSSNPYDTECVSLLQVNVNSTSAQTTNTTAIESAATGSSTVSGLSILGAALHGRALAGNGLATGAYIEGRRDVSTASALGMELRAINIGTTGAVYNTSGIGTVDDAWLTCSGDGTNTAICGSSLHVGQGSSLNLWHAGLTIDSNAIDSTGFGVDDESAGVIGLKENGTHTYALVTGSSAGNVGFGTLTPGYGIQAINTTGYYFGSSGSNADIFHLDNSAGGQQDVLEFDNAGASKWQMGKNTDNSFFFYDNANGHNFLTIGTNGFLQLGEDTQINIGTSGTNAVAIGTSSFGSMFDVNGGVSIGTSYVGTAAPTNGAIIQGGVALGTSAQVSGSELTINGLISSEGGLPTCGTGCSSVASGSTNTRGRATGGSAVTSIVVNWSSTLSSAPVCVPGQSSTGAAMGISTSTTAITFTLASSLSSDVVSWICMQ